MKHLTTIRHLTITKHLTIKKHLMIKKHLTITKYLTIVLLLALSATAFSQYYPREVGSRGGYSSGLTFRVNLDDELSYEAQLLHRHQGAIFTMFRLKHQEMGMDKSGNWEFIYGMGVHTGFYFTDSYRIFFEEIYYSQDHFSPVFGVDGYIGIDYLLENLPMSFGVSYQPHMEISLRQLFGINLWDFGIHVRYRF
ncbi:MAG: hypothetical protein GY790_01660 [Bacteroidetes bacterium]|nr:hypothetical protein [Bacteroidota bacterium]